MDDRMRLLAAAVLEGATWCELVCRGAGVRSRWAPGAWTSADRTPPSCPDAVTLAATTRAGQLLAHVDLSTPGCSVVDSFATLDLRAAGFAPTLEGSWVARPPGPPGRPCPPAGGLAWEVVADATALAAWDAARGAVVPLDPSLLDHADVTVIAGRGGDGDLVAGAVLHERAPVVGVAAAWSAEGDLDGPWAAAVVAARALAPRAAVVGHGWGPALAAAARAGCVPLGPLRVWRRP